MIQTKPVSAVASTWLHTKSWWKTYWPEYAERSTGTPTTSKNQIGKPRLTSNSSTPTTYENLGRKGVKPEQFIGRDEKLKELHK